MDISEIEAPEAKKSKGRPTVSEFQKMTNPDIMYCLREKYYRIAEHLRKRNKLYGKKNVIITALYDKCHEKTKKKLTLESLFTYINRSKKHRTSAKKSNK